jgi:hypothetical protein
VPCSSLARCALVAVVVARPASAGIADSPLPVLQAGQTTVHLYSVPGVLNDGGSNLATFFTCTSTSTSSPTVGVELFPAAGGGSFNNAAAEALSVAPGATVTFGTVGAGNLFTDQALSILAGVKGSARILSTSKHLVGTAFLADVADNTPTSMVELTIIAKVKQKAATDYNRAAICLPNTR